MAQTLTVGLLIVSTTAAQDPTTDAAGPLLRDFFASVDAGSASWSVTDTQIVTDDNAAIQERVRYWADEMKLNLIVTTGGTGFAVSDGTPEAVRPLLQKEAPGLVHAMLASSLSVTPFAMMSRPVAGVRNSSLIITVPGSPKGAKENLEALIKLLPHACIQIAGSTSSRALHSGGITALEKQHGVHSHHPTDSSSGGHHHHHHHDHDHGHGHKVPRPHTTPEQRANKLDGPVAHRHRASPYEMTSVADATAIVQRETPAGEVVTRPVDSSLVGHVLAEDVTARESVPAYRASIVDGYAVIHTDGAGVFPVVAVAHAAPTDTTAAALQPGQVARITTGAPLPPGATAVVMVEDTILKSMAADGREEATVEILASDLTAGENVREIGSDVAAGTVILRAGRIISGVGGEIGLLASVGVATVRVFRKLTVGVLSTGDEVVPHSLPGGLNHGEIRDSNRPALLAALTSAGFPTVDLGIAADRPGALAATLTAALDSADVVITTGGVSMGELDLLKPTLEQALGATIHFGRVAMKPGKPTTFATVPPPPNNPNDGSSNEGGGGSGGGRTRLVFALPGNPASALVTLHLFVLPSLRQAAGYVPAALPRVPVIAAHDFRLDPRPEFHRVNVAVASDGTLVATSTGVQRSSRIGSAGGANAVLCLPARKETSEKRAALGVLPKGEKIEAMLWGQIAAVDTVSSSL